MRKDQPWIIHLRPLTAPRQSDFCNGISTIVEEVSVSVNVRQHIGHGQRRGTLRSRKGVAPVTGKLIAWINTTTNGEIVAAFVGEAAKDERLPARKVCGSVEQAYAWVEREAAYVDLSVEWVDSPDPSE